MFHFIPVTMTVRKDGVDHLLSSDVPNCPGGCLSGVLDMLPLPVDLVQVREHSQLDLGTLQWTAEHTSSPYGMAFEVNASIRDQIEAQDIFAREVPAKRQMHVAFVADGEPVFWNKQRAGFAGYAATIVANSDFYPGDDEGWAGFYLRKTLTHELGHMFGAMHAWMDNFACVLQDPDFPYHENAGFSDVLISGDPDGDGPLRIRPAYARLGAGGQLNPYGEDSAPSGFLEQTVEAYEIMGCSVGGGPDEYSHLSDYHYLIALFGAGQRAALSWATDVVYDGKPHDCLAWGALQGRWSVGDGPCPWRGGGDSPISGFDAKSIRAAVVGKTLLVSGYMNGDGSFIGPGTDAKWGRWPDIPPPTAGTLELIAYDSHGVRVHEQPLARRCSTCISTSYRARKESH